MMRNLKICISHTKKDCEWHYEDGGFHFGKCVPAHTVLRRGLVNEREKKS